MAVNPMKLMQLKGRFDLFRSQHPKLIPFFRQVAPELDEGSRIEIQITTAAGKTAKCGIRLNADDIETLKSVL